MLETGQHQGYFWCETATHSLNTIMERCPEFLLGKHVVITAFDGGELHPTAEEISRGWKKSRNVAVSPMVDEKELSQLPYDNHDEWFLFDVPTSFAYDEPLVNYGAFSLVDTTKLSELLETSWDGTIREAHVREASELQRRFWQIMRKLEPAGYIADGARLVIATNNQREFSILRNALVSS